MRSEVLQYPAFLSQLSLLHRRDSGQSRRDAAEGHAGADKREDGAKSQGIAHAHAATTGSINIYVAQVTVARRMNWDDSDDD